MKNTNVKEQKGFVATNDEDKAEDLAKKGVNVKLTAEQEHIQGFSKEETSNIAKEVAKALTSALRTVGDEVAGGSIKDIQENSFEVFIEYKDGFEDTFSFYIDGENDTLHMTDFSFDTPVGEVGVKPSGEAMVHSEILKNNLVKHFKSLNEQDDDKGSGEEMEWWEDFEKASREIEMNEQETVKQAYLRLLDQYKRKSGPEKEQVGKKLKVVAKKLGIDFNLNEEDSEEFEDRLFNIFSKYISDPDDIEKTINFYLSYGFGRLPDELKANLQRDMDFETLSQQRHDEKTWEKEGGMNENINPEVTKLVNRFIGGLAKRYNYDTQSAVNAIMTVLRNQKWQGINEEFKPNVAPGSTYAIQVSSLGNRVVMEQDNQQVVVVHKDDIHDLIRVLQDMDE